MAQAVRGCRFLASVPLPPCRERGRGADQSALAAEAATRGAPRPGGRQHGTAGPAPDRAASGGTGGGDGHRRRFRGCAAGGGWPMVTACCVRSSDSRVACRLSSLRRQARLRGIQIAWRDQVPGRGINCRGGSGEARRRRAPGPETRARLSWLPASGTGISRRPLAGHGAFQAGRTPGGARAWDPRVPAASASATSVAAVPSPALRGAVLH